MAAGSKGLIVAAALAAVAVTGGLKASSSGGLKASFYRDAGGSRAMASLAGREHQVSAAPAPRRIVSVVPALTEILFAIGAGPQVVAVSSYDEFPPEVKRLPRVGALLDPDIERILGLRPDLVFVYGSQADQQGRLERAGIRTFAYRHGGVSTVLDTIGDVGDATGHAGEAAALVDTIRGRLDAVRARVKGLRRPRVLLVFERQPRTLREIYASGGIGFLHDMLEIAGGENVFADVKRESVQPSTEMLLARAPEVILEVRASGLIEARDVAEERRVWSALPGVPAVRTGRVHFLSAPYLVVPGPRVAEGAEALARALHPDAGGAERGQTPGGGGAAGSGPGRRGGAGPDPEDGAERGQTPGGGAEAGSGPGRRGGAGPDPEDGEERGQAPGGGVRPPGGGVRPRRRGASGWRKCRHAIRAASSA